jgi:hypothetical protein
MVSFDEVMSGIVQVGNLPGAIAGGNLRSTTKAVGGGVGDLMGGLGGALTANPVFLMAGAIVLLMLLK